MKIRCLNCGHGYTPLYGYGSGEEVQSCDYGLHDGAAPVGEYCRKDGKKLREVKGGKQ